MCNIWFLLGILCFYFEFTLCSDRMTWTEYRKMNNLRSKTMAENHHHREIYMKNLAKIEEHNDKFRKGLVPYSMKMNQFGHLTQEEFIKKNIGLVYSEKNHKRRYVEVYQPQKNVTLPAAVDWRLQGAITPITYQYGCGACYAFAAIGAIESHYYITSKKTIYLSTQQLIDCGGNYTMNGCNGGSTQGALAYGIHIGLTTESIYPYERASGPCRLSNHQIKIKLKAFKKIKEGSIHDMEAAVAFGGPVTVILNGTPLTFITGNEILTGRWCINYDQTHAVVVVGYNTTSKGQNYWIIKNSWGETWGDGGYFYLERHKDDLCGLTRESYIPYME